VSYFYSSVFRQARRVRHLELGDARTRVAVARQGAREVGRHQGRIGNFEGSQGEPTQVHPASRRFARRRGSETHPGEHLSDDG